MDAREWRDEIADAMDFYNGMGFDQAEAEGIVKPDADFFVANMSFSTEDDDGKILADMDVARGKMDEIWYGICYGPFGGGPWQIMTKGVMNGWKNVFTCNEDAAFCGIGDFDWRCASLGMGVEDVLEMSEMCPISGNATIIGGIDIALDFAESGGLSTNQKSRVVRFLKRALGELYKRGKAMMTIMGEEATLSQFFEQLTMREFAAKRFFGWAAMPEPDVYRERMDMELEAQRREMDREQNALRQKIEAIRASKKH